MKRWATSAAIVAAGLVLLVLVIWLFQSTAEIGDAAAAHAGRWSARG